MTAFKPVLVARGVIRFVQANAVSSCSGHTEYKSSSSQLLTEEEVQVLGHDTARIIALFEHTRIHLKYPTCVHVCQFCSSVWGVSYEHDYRDAYTEEESPMVWCCGRCFAKVLHAPGAASPYALYGRGKRWAEMKPGHSPWEGRALFM
jgi:hypothetical protein